MVKINRENLQAWLAIVNFAEHGDKLERKLHEFSHEEFPGVEDFWRRFVVPLTTRLLDYPNPAKPSISFRAEVDDQLQHICSANYSVFVHLALAKRELETWNEEQSLELVYLRLSSSFDVFESLCFAFSKLLHECRGTVPAGLERFDEKRITEIATSFAAKRYSKSFDKFAAKGQAVTIRLHNVDGVIAQYFAGVDSYRDYKNHSATVRRMRNALVHDLRLGQIADANGKILIPRPAQVDRYRSWSEILSAPKSAERVKTDFNEPIVQAESDLKITLKILNDLYLKLIDDFDSEFCCLERSKLRERFHVELCTSAEEQSGAAESEKANLGANIVSNFGRSLTAQLSVSTVTNLEGTTDVTGASGVAHMPKPKSEPPLILPSGTAPWIPPQEE